MSTLLRPNEKPKALKNLGWLLRNWQQVESLGFNYDHDSKNMIDGQLIARLKGGSVYMTDYASLSVCWNWLDRPVFRTLSFKLVWGKDFEHSMDYVIGNADWKRINRLPYAEQMASIITAGK